MKVYTIEVNIYASDEIGHPVVIEQTLCDIAASFDNVLTAQAEILSVTDRPDEEESKPECPFCNGTDCPPDNCNNADDNPHLTT